MIESKQHQWREVGGGEARWRMGIKEGACDGHWVCVSDETLNSAPDADTALYVTNKNVNKIKQIKRL